jgi:hypothetical protein
MPERDYARERDALAARQPTRDRFHLGDLLRGGTARATRALPILETRQTLLEKSLPPAPDHIRGRVQPPRGLSVRQPVSPSAAQRSIFARCTTLNGNE